jgi:L-ribulose-5-phosphate 3-epimerase
MLKIGVRAHDYGRDVPESLFARIHADGFVSVQLALKKAIIGMEHFEDITPDGLKKVKSALSQNEVNVAVLGAYLELASANETERAANIGEFVKSIPLAKELGADCIATETTGRILQPGITREEAMRLLLDSLCRIMPAAEELDVIVAIEPVAVHTVNTPECAAEVLKAIQSPHLKILFDPVNLLTAEDAIHPELLWDRAFACFGDKIAAVHIKGVTLNNENQLVRVKLEQSILHYEDIFGRLKALHTDIGILREEFDVSSAKADCKFLMKLAEK